VAQIRLLTHAKEESAYRYAIAQMLKKETADLNHMVEALGLALSTVPVGGNVVLSDSPASRGSSQGRSLIDSRNNSTRIVFK